MVNVITGNRIGTFQEGQTEYKNVGMITTDQTGQRSLAITQDTGELHEGSPIRYEVTLPMKGSDNDLQIDLRGKVSRSSSVLGEYPLRRNFFTESGSLYLKGDTVVEISEVGGDFLQNRGQRNYRIYKTDPSGQQLPWLIEYLSLRPQYSIGEGGVEEDTGITLITYGKLKEVRGLREVPPVIPDEDPTIIEDNSGRHIGFAYYIHMFRLVSVSQFSEEGKDTIFRRSPIDLVDVSKRMSSEGKVVEKEKERFYGLTFNELNGLKDRVAQMMKELNKYPKARYSNH